MTSKGRKPTRRSERALAFQVLYGLTFSPATSLGGLRDAYTASPDVADKGEFEGVPAGFAWELVEGVWKTATTLDEIIGRYSQNWRLDRMGKIELTLLRIAIYEMVYRTDVPAKVAINEALELSKQFGDANARSFINGILDAAAKAQETGELAPKV